MICPTCRTEMKPLLTGMYCPNDCDRTVAKFQDAGWPAPDQIWHCQEGEGTLAESAPIVWSNEQIRKILEDADWQVKWSGEE